MENTHKKASELMPHYGQARTKGDPEALADLTLQVGSLGIEPDRPIVVDEDNYVVKGHRRWAAYMLAHHMEEVGKELTKENVMEVLQDIAGQDVEVASCPDCGGLVDTSQMWMHCNDCDQRWWKGEISIPGSEGYEDAPDETKLLTRTIRVIDERAVPHVHIKLSELYPNLLVPVHVRAYVDAGDEMLALLSDNFGDEEPDTLGLLQAFSVAKSEGVPIDTLARATGKTEHFVRGVLALAELDNDLTLKIIDNNWPLTIPALVGELEGDAKKGVQSWLKTYNHTPSVKTVRETVERVQAWNPDVIGFGLEDTAQDRNTKRAARYAWTWATAKNPVKAWGVIAGGAYGALQALLEVAGLTEDDMIEDLGALQCESCQLRNVLPSVPELKWSPGYPCQEIDNPTGCVFAVPEGEPASIKVGWQYPGENDDGWVRDVQAFVEVMQEWVEDQDVEVSGDDLGHHEKGPTPTEQMRANIAEYMATHVLFSGSEHPLATMCKDCQHKTETSPVQSREVPHCEWARRRRNLSFCVWQMGDYIIPICRQYMPKAALAEIIPGHWHEIHLPKDFLIEGIRRRIAWLASKGMTYYLSQLTGQPMSSKDKTGGRWLGNRFEEEVGYLQHDQVVTLWLWLDAVVSTSVRGHEHAGLVLPAKKEFHTFKARTFPWGKYEVVADNGPLMEGTDG